MLVILRQIIGLERDREGEKKREREREREREKDMLLRQTSNNSCIDVNLEQVLT